MAIRNVKNGATKKNKTNLIGENLGLRRGDVPQWAQPDGVYLGRINGLHERMCSFFQ